MFTQPLLCPLNGQHQGWEGLTNRLSDKVGVFVAAENISNTLRERDGMTHGVSGHITVSKGVCYR